jgi:hypothetical protein
MNKRQSPPSPNWMEIARRKKARGEFVCGTPFLADFDEEAKDDVACLDGECAATSAAISTPGDTSSAPEADPDSEIAR